ncbi:hypothetical protein [Roseovarius sp. 2305UL8-3]|uniref:hypothetical protein n=1 Tax=Roseovarius conchicola TaxID=3121636 RepID=UPI003528DD1C
MKRERTYSMEDFFGALLLIGALFALGLFNFRSDEPLVEAGIRAQANAITTESVHGLRAIVDGRNITLTGLADSEVEKDDILGQLRKIEGRGKLRSEVTLLERIEPFALGARLEEGGDIKFTGGVPSEAVRDALRQDFGEGVDALTLASGSPDEHWPNVATAGLRGLSQLDHGILKLQDQTVRLTGDALTPDIRDRALLLIEDLPEGYVVSHKIVVLDDGTPLRLNAARSEGGTPSLSGKLPAELVGQLPTTEGAEIAASPLPVPFEGWGQGVLQGVGALEHLHSGHLAVIGRSLTLTGDAWSQEAYDKVMATLEGLPSRMQVSADITLADSGAPFGLTLEVADGIGVASGKVPRSLSSPVLSALIGVPLEDDGLEIARISPGQVWWDAASIGAEGLSMSESGTLKFDGTTLSLNALVQDPLAAEELTMHLAGLPEGVELALDLTLIDDGTPVRLTLDFDGKNASASGKLPDSLTLTMLSDALGVELLEDTLIITPNPPPLNWQAAAITGADALTLFARGRLELTGDQLLLRGTVLNPAREREVLTRLENLPAGYSAMTDLTFQDDGRPFAFRLDFDGHRATLSGKTPSDLGPASQAAILGYPVTADALDFAAIPADAEWWIAARASLKALSLLQKGTLSMDAHQITLTGTAGDTSRADTVTKQLAVFEEDFKLTLEITAP